MFKPFQEHLGKSMFFPPPPPPPHKTHRQVAYYMLVLVEFENSFWDILFKLSVSASCW